MEHDAGHRDSNGLNVSDPTKFRPEEIDRVAIERSITPGIGLRAARELCELSREQLSNATGISPIDLAKLEESSDDLNPVLAHTLSRALHLTPSLLMAWNSDLRANRHALRSE